ncbi:MAG: hypothetical protein V4858_00655 [Pseudomonadota bacterium]
MKSRMTAAVLLSGLSHAWAATASFDADAVGQPPAGWTCGATGKGTPRWAVDVDATAPTRPNVLKQYGSADFPWCVRNDVLMQDGAVEVKFKPMSGKEDQAGGLVWRWKDGNNYYVARANALEGNVSLYHTSKGSRKTIEYKDAPVAPGVWHTLRVTFKDASIQVALDGRTYIDVRDNHIAGGGKIGVWTKADSVSSFDDFSY